MYVIKRQNSISYILDNWEEQFDELCMDLFEIMTCDVFAIISLV